MAKKVRTIPATLNRFTAAPVTEVRKRRVAGYARVSTDSEEQASSYEAQMSYYQEYIGSRDDWEFVGMYSDEGISATNTKHREGFNKMIEDALAGKIDLIVTKSVSRFARNTVDSLTTVRKLKEKGVEIYFEKENIWTLDSKGELLITIMSSLAQEESRSISENTTWGKRKQFADGKASVGYSTFLGYGQDFKIIPEEAKTVELIYDLFISGLSIYAIKQELERRGLKAPAGGKTWHVSSVRSILTNEKYKGDALLQKEFTVDFLEKTRKKNEGEVQQYYVEGHHEAIIPPRRFAEVQAELKRREAMTKYSGVSIFSNKIKCGCCGGWYGSKVWHSNDKYRKVIYRCNHKYGKEKKVCGTPTLTEPELKNYFLKALGSMVELKEEYIENLQLLLETVSDVSTLEQEEATLETEVEAIAQKVQELITQNARVAQDQEDYARKEQQLIDLYEIKSKRLEEIEDQISAKENAAEGFRDFISILEEEEATEFDDTIWGRTVEFLTVQPEGSVVFTLKGGIEVAV